MRFCWCCELDNGPMVMCSASEGMQQTGWDSCVQSAARGLKKYACPLCMALKGHPADLDSAIGRTRRTRCAPILAAAATGPPLPDNSLTLCTSVSCALEGCRAQCAESSHTRLSRSASA